MWLLFHKDIIRSIDREVHRCYTDSVIKEYLNVYAEVDDGTATRQMHCITRRKDMFPAFSYRNLSLVTNSTYRIHIRAKIGNTYKIRGELPRRYFYSNGSRSIGSFRDK